MIKRLKNNKGFTIVEALVSFFIITLLICIIFNFSAKFYSCLITRSLYNKLYMENCSAMDHICRNISQAPADLDLWLKFSENQVIWRDKLAGMDFGYQFEKVGNKKGLYFVVGNYGPGGWTKRRKNLISKSVTGISFAKEDKTVTQEVARVFCKIFFLFKDGSAMASAQNYEQNCEQNFSRVILLKNRTIFYN